MAAFGRVYLEDQVMHLLLLGLVGFPVVLDVLANHAVVDLVLVEQVMLVLRCEVLLQLGGLGAFAVAQAQDDGLVLLQNLLHLQGWMNSEVLAQLTETLDLWTFVVDEEHLRDSGLISGFVGFDLVVEERELLETVNVPEAVLAEVNAVFN